MSLRSWLQDKIGRNGTEPVTELAEELPQDEDAAVEQSKEGTRLMKEEMGRFHKGMASASATTTDLAADMEEYRQAQRASGFYDRDELAKYAAKQKCAPIPAPLLQRSLEILRERPNIPINELAELLRVGRDLAVRVHNKAYEVLHGRVPDEAASS